MLGLAIGFIISGLWIAFEVWKAPVYDDELRIVEPEKKLSNIFKKNYKNK